MPAIAKFLIAVMPWHQIFAWLFRQFADHAAAGKVSQETLDRVAEAAAAGVHVASTALDAKAAGQPVTPIIQAGVTGIINDALTAWSDKAPTPADYKATVRYVDPAAAVQVPDIASPAAPGLTPIVGDGTPASPRGFAKVPGQQVLTQEDVSGLR